MISFTFTEKNKFIRGDDKFSYYYYNWQDEKNKKGDKKKFFMVCHRAFICTYLQKKITANQTLTFLHKNTIVHLLLL